MSIEFGQLIEEIKRTREEVAAGDSARDKFSSRSKPTLID